MAFADFFKLSWKAVLLQNDNHFASAPIGHLVNNSKRINMTPSCI